MGERIFLVFPHYENEWLLSVGESDQTYFFLIK